MFYFTCWPRSMTYSTQLYLLCKQQQQSVLATHGLQSPRGQSFSLYIVGLQRYWVREAGSQARCAKGENEYSRDMCLATPLTWSHPN